jgi:site-specific DNA recombinase
MLHELIDYIEVHQSEKIDGVNIQRLIIHYNCVGTIDIPEIIPSAEFTLDTRKGVAVSYSNTKNYEK